MYRDKSKVITEIVKQELPASIAEHSDEEEDYLQLNEEVRNAEESKDGI